ncbi:hypothetical protein key_139 [Erwinia phage KEY]|uniref:Uncharacterized protein n=1 Tax=Erwinia phage KEY TaxID=2821255 RepID=A0AAE7WB25_9CAUD|nr:hypothetical protein key_139 [Erwinia phage KEY]
MEKNPQNLHLNYVEQYIEEIKARSDISFVVEDVMTNRLNAAKSILAEEVAEEVKLITMLATIADNIGQNVEDPKDAYRLLNNALAAYIEARTHRINTSANTRDMDEACLEVAIMKVNGAPLN